MSDQVEISTARFLDISEAEYHRDPCPTPSLSSSIANILLDRSPMHAHHAHPRLGGAKRTATDSMDRGSLIHRLVLGAGAEIVIVDADDWRTKVAKEARDEARERGAVPVLAGDHADAEEASAIITQRFADLGVEFVGRSEVAMIWEDTAGVGSTWCRGMLDHVLPNGMIYDLKSTARSAHPKACAKAVIDGGYTTQRAAYVRGLSKVWPQLDGRIDFRFLFCEVDPPYGVCVGKPDALMRELGDRRWERAVGDWIGCLRRKSWPGYTVEHVTLDSPGWLLARSEEAA